MLQSKMFTVFLAVLTVVSVEELWSTHRLLKSLDQVWEADGSSTTVLGQVRVRLAALRWLGPFKNPHVPEGRHARPLRWVLRDVTRPFLKGIVRPWRRNPTKLMICLLLAVLLARESLLYLCHLQHGKTNNSSSRHLGSLSPTARCAFSVHLQDLCHLFRVLGEEAYTLWEEIVDNVRYTREVVRVMSLLETWQRRRGKMKLAKNFIKGYEAGHCQGLRVGRTAGFVAGKQTSGVEAYVWGWRKGSEQGHRRGLSQGQREGFDTGYNDGYDKGKAEGKRHGAG